MSLKYWSHDRTERRTGGSSVSYSRLELAWSGLPENIKIKRVYWQWDINRQSGNVYARWYYGTSGNTISGNTGMNGTGVQFDVTSKVSITGTSGTAWVYLGAQNGWADYSNITFNIEFDYLQSSFTLSTTNVDAGGKITANISVQDPTATHKVTWQFGTRKDEKTLSAGTNKSEFTVLYSWLDQIPNTTSGLASCTMETINAAGTSVGSSTLYFNIVAPASVVPKIDTFTATMVNNDVPSNWGVYVQGQSGVTVKATASGTYGSTISKYTITGDGKMVNNDTLSISKLSGSGSLTFKVTVTDSRGRSASTSMPITVHPWSPPATKSLTAVRCLSNGTIDPSGTSMYVTFDGTISSVNGKNAVLTDVTYRVRGSGNWMSAAIGSSPSGSWVIANDAALATNAYEVRVVLTDAFTSSITTTVCSTVDCYIDQMPGRRRLGIGAYCPTDDTVYFDQDLLLRHGENSLLTDADISQLALSGDWSDLRNVPGGVVRIQTIANAATYATGATIQLFQDPTKYTLILARLDWGGVAVSAFSGSAGSRTLTFAAVSSSSNIKHNVAVLKETDDITVWTVESLARILGDSTSVRYPTLGSLNIGPIWGLEVVS